MRACFLPGLYPSSLYPFRSISLTLHAHLINPIPPLLPLPVQQTHLFSLVRHNLALAISPRLLPRTTAPIPACLPHQRDHRLILGPALFFRNIREISRSVPPAVVRERNSNTVLAQLPVQGAFIRRGELG